MIDRRMFLLAAAALPVAACTPAGPGAATLRATARAGMNPGPDGADRPVTLQVVQMRGSGAFDSADAFALQSPQAALGADFIRADVITLPPGGDVSKVIAFDAATSVLGVTAGFRDPGGKVFRAKVGVDPTSSPGFLVDVGPSGISLMPA